MPIDGRRLRPGPGGQGNAAASAGRAGGAELIPPEGGRSRAVFWRWGSSGARDEGDRAAGRTFVESDRKPEDDGPFWLVATKRILGR